MTGDRAGTKRDRSSEIPKQIHSESDPPVVPSLIYVSRDSDSADRRVSGELLTADHRHKALSQKVPIRWNPSLIGSWLSDDMGERSPLSRS
jgi:hypothetical protein